MDGKATPPDQTLVTNLVIENLYQCCLLPNWDLEEVRLFNHLHIFWIFSVITKFVIEKSLFFL